MTWDTNPQGRGTDYAPETHASTHRKLANDYLPHFLSEDAELGAPTAEGDIIRALVVSGRLQWQRSINLYIAGAARIGSATEPFNHAAGDATVDGILSVATNVAPALGVKAQVTGAVTVSKWFRAGSLTALTGATTDGDITGKRVFIEDANFKAELSASNPLITFDANDTMKYDRTANTLTVTLGSTDRMSIDANGQLKLPVVGSGAGILMGADTQFYREAADIINTPDKLHVQGELELDGDLNHDGTNVGLYNHAPSPQGTGGENLTNNVTVGGTTGTITNYTDLLVYANDAGFIRNNLYQLARALKQDHDQLRAMGILT